MRSSYIKNYPMGRQVFFGLIIGINNLMLAGVCQRFNTHCKENPIYVFLFWELRGLSPNFHISGNIYIAHRYISVGTGIKNIIILFWKYQFHFWEYTNGNQTFIVDSYWPFICSAGISMTKNKAELSSIILWLSSPSNI